METPEPYGQNNSHESVSFLLQSCFLFLFFFFPDIFSKFYIYTDSWTKSSFWNLNSVCFLSRNCTEKIITFLLTAVSCVFEDSSHVFPSPRLDRPIDHKYICAFIVYFSGYWNPGINYIVHRRLEWQHNRIQNPVLCMNEECVNAYLTSVFAYDALWLFLINCFVKCLIMIAANVLPVSYHLLRTILFSWNIYVSESSLRYEVANSRFSFQKLVIWLS